MAAATYQVTSDVFYVVRKRQGYGIRIKTFVSGENGTLELLLFEHDLFKHESFKLYLFKLYLFNVCAQIVEVLY